MYVEDDTRAPEKIKQVTPEGVIAVGTLVWVAPKLEGCLG